ncbi:hypothetical protein, partial [Microbacterium sp. HJ5]
TQSTTGTDSDRRGTVSDDGSKKSKEKPAAAGSSSQRPAHAGANAENRSTKPGLGAKKDRSRDSPERRD